jgi:hypothetical protein
MNLQPLVAEGGNRLIQNVGISVPNYTASHTSRPWSIYSPPREPQIRHSIFHIQISFQYTMRNVTHWVTGSIIIHDWYVGLQDEGLVVTFDIVTKVSGTFLKTLHVNAKIVESNNVTVCSRLTWLPVGHTQSSLLYFVVSWNIISVCGC